MYTRGYLHSIINVEQIIIVVYGENCNWGLGHINFDLDWWHCDCTNSDSSRTWNYTYVYKYRPEWCATDKEEYHRIKKERLERESKESE